MKNEKSPYARINNGIDEMIKKHGSEKTADFIQAISNSQSLSFDEVNINLQKFIYAEVIKQFKIKPSLFETSKTEPYKQARLSCIFLYNHYCNYTASMIKTKFKGIKKTLFYFYSSINKMEELIQIPAINKNHYSIHMKADEKIQEFINNKSK